MLALRFEGSRFGVYGLGAKEWGCWYLGGSGAPG